MAKYSRYTATELLASANHLSYRSTDTYREGFLRRRRRRWSQHDHFVDDRHSSARCRGAHTGHRAGHLPLQRRHRQRRLHAVRLVQHRGNVSKRLAHRQLQPYRGCRAKRAAAPTRRGGTRPRRSQSGPNGDRTSTTRNVIERMGIFSLTFEIANFILCLLVLLNMSSKRDGMVIFYVRVLITSSLF